MPSSNLIRNFWSQLESVHLRCIHYSQLATVIRMAWDVFSKALQWSTKKATWSNEVKLLWQVVWFLIISTSEPSQLSSQILLVPFLKIAAISFNHQGLQVLQKFSKDIYEIWPVHQQGPGWNFWHPGERSSRFSNCKSSLSLWCFGTAGCGRLHDSSLLSFRLAAKCRSAHLLFACFLWFCQSLFFLVSWKAALFFTRILAGWMSLLDFFYSGT